VNSPFLENLDLELTVVERIIQVNLMGVMHQPAILMINNPDTSSIFLRLLVCRSEMHNLVLTVHANLPFLSTGFV
jgi:hypothetical protein